MNVKPLRFAKNVEFGDLLILRGDKLVKARRGSKKIFGVLNYSSKVVVIDYQGVRHDIEIPEGVRVYGEAYVNYGG